MTVVRVFPDPVALGEALAEEIATGIDAARRDGRAYVLGCPGGRSPRSTYQALVRRTVGADLGHLVIAMMDDYVEHGPDGGWQHVAADAHFSCRRFAAREIAEPLSAGAAVPVRPDHVWLPDPADPEGHERRLADAGGVDLFILASGASDGHVAFVAPGGSADGGVSIVPLAETTRRDNMATFPAFASLDEVPTHGVSVGLGTIVRQSRSARLVLLGDGKRHAAQRVLGTRNHDLSWPATIVHRCRDGQVWLDAAAEPGPSTSRADRRSY